MAKITKAMAIRQMHEKMDSKTVCSGCGSPLTYKEEFIGLPCNHYCCNCCPSKSEKRCPKEQQFGSPFDDLWE